MDGNEDDGLVCQVDEPAQGSVRYVEIILTILRVLYQTTKDPCFQEEAVQGHGHMNHLHSQDLCLNLGQFEVRGNCPDHGKIEHS